MRITEKGLLFAFLSPFLSSISTVFVSGAVRLLNPYIVMSFSSLIASVALFIYLLLKKDKLDISLFKKNYKDFWKLTISRQLIAYSLFIFGLTLTDAIKVIFFTKAEAYFVLLWAWAFHKEKVQLKHLILLLIHIMGALILSTGGNFQGLGKAQLGDLLILLSSGFFALSYFPAKRLVDKIGPAQLNGSTLFITALVFLPFALLLSSPESWKSVVGWQYLTLNALIVPTLAVTLWFASLKTVKGWMVSALRSVGPLAGAPFAYFLFGETLSPIQIMGGAIVLSTSFLIAREHIRSTKKV